MQGCGATAEGPALLRMGGCQHGCWPLLREGWRGEEGGKKPGPMPPPLLSPQHIPNLLALGPNDQHFPMHPQDPVPSPG